jgi:hypothetical protein
VYSGKSGHTRHTGKISKTAQSETSGCNDSYIDSIIIGSETDKSVVEKNKKSSLFKVFVNFKRFY